MLRKTFKKIIPMILCAAVTLGIGCVKTPTTVQASTNFAKGADIGWLNQLEDKGVKWQNDKGNEQDPLEIMKENGINAVRLRVFVNPPSNYQWTKNDGTTCFLGYSDKKAVVYMAQRAKKLGMKVMIDFHYSDHFADPAYQDKPSAWANDDFDTLKTDVYNHTYDVMSALADAGIYPEWVQVGNEINTGMMWPDGSNYNYNKLSQLINKGYDAVKAVSSSSKVVIHLSSGTKNSMYRDFFDGLKGAGAKYDVIGMSYYPYWNNVDYTKDIDTLASNLNDMASRYQKEVMICETGGDQNDEDKTYKMIKEVIKKVKDVPNGKGIGVFYWEPEANSSVLPDEYPLGACSKVSENVLKFTRAIHAFK